MASIYQQFIEHHENEIINIVRILAEKYKFRVVDALKFINNRVIKQKCYEIPSTRINMIMLREAEERKHVVNQLIKQITAIKN